MKDQIAQTYEALLNASLNPVYSEGQHVKLLAEHAGARLISLASAQLDAYNQGDLDAFCACYSLGVQVYRAGELMCEGFEAFRERYAPLFAGGGFGASVVERRLDPLPDTLTEAGVSVSCVDTEDWWRGSGEAKSAGRVWVRYHLRLTMKEALTSDRERRGSALIERVEFSERPFW